MIPILVLLVSGWLMFIVELRDHQRLKKHFDSVMKHWENTIHALEIEFDAHARTRQELLSLKSPKL